MSYVGEDLLVPLEPLHVKSQTFDCSIHRSCNYTRGEEWATLLETLLGGQKQCVKCKDTRKETQRECLAETRSTQLDMFC